MFPFFAMLGDMRIRSRAEAAQGLRNDLDEMVRAGDWEAHRWTRARYFEKTRELRPTRYYPRVDLNNRTRTLQDRLGDAICYEILWGAVN